MPDKNDDDVTEEDEDEDVGAPRVVVRCRGRRRPSASTSGGTLPPTAPELPLEAPLPASGDGVASDEETTEAALLDLFKKERSLGPRRGQRAHRELRIIKSCSRSGTRYMPELCF